jgi:hypothetical protein
MNKDLQKEEEFYAKEFNFSYSSLNRLLFSPSLFYKDYILQDREIRTDKHLIEGKLVHCLLFEPENFEKKFNLMPGKTPSDNVRKVLKDMTLVTDAATLAECDDFIITDSLLSLNLYQSLKTDESRIAKIRTPDNEVYWKFLSKSNMDTVDQETYNKCLENVETIKENKDVMKLFEQEQTDFDLDPITSYKEKYLKSELQNLDFGLHGYIDYFKVDTENKTAVISDLKTTSKSITDFRETVDFYNYWLQAAIYMKLVYDFLGDDKDSYRIDFNFIVIDKYNQVYVFEVGENSINTWADGLGGVLKTADFHYKSRNYSLPMDFLVNKVKL